MNDELKDISQQQRESWNNFSPGWKKWDGLTMEFLRPMGDEIIRLLELDEDDTVLDVASGTGEPGLTIAGIVKNGKVIGNDISEGMLAVAAENARAKGITNYDTRAGDISALPFPDASFDAISCRMGFMFFPDMALALTEMHRVLKSGGRIATSVWGDPKHNFWVTVTMGTINELIELPPPPPGAPGMFRCAGDGLMSDLFRQAGFTDIREQIVNTKLPCETPEMYWEMITEVGAPIVAALDKADAATRERIKDEVFRRISDKYPGGNAMMDAQALVVGGRKQ